MGFRILLLTSAVFIVQQWRCSYCSVGEGRLPQCLSLPMLDLVSRHSLRKSKNVISVLGGSVNNFDVLIGFEGQRHRIFLSWGSMGACSINNCTKDCHPSQMRETIC